MVNSNVRASRSVLALSLAFLANSCSLDRRPAGPSDSPNLSTVRSSQPRDRYTLDEVFADLARDIPGFSGLYYDGSTGALTANLVNLASAETARSVLTSHFAGRRVMNRNRGDGLRQATGADVHFRVVKYDYLTLKGWYDVVRPLVPSGRIILSDIDEVNNRLAFGARDSSDLTAVRAILDQAGVASDAYRVFVMPPTNAAQWWIDGWLRPIPGGMQIEFHDDDDPCGDDWCFCTLGFNALVDGNPHFVTASHCSDDTASPNNASAYYQYDHIVSNGYIGDEVIDPGTFTGGACTGERVCRWADALLAEYSDPDMDEYGYLPTPASFDDFEMELTSGRMEIIGEGYDAYANWFLTKMGRSTGVSSGYVSTAPGFASGTCMDFQYSTEAWLCQYSVHAHVAGGDSGGPVFDEVNGDVYVWGVLIGQTCDDDDCWFWFSDMENIHTDLGAFSID